MKRNKLRLSEHTLKIGSGKTPLGGASTYVDEGVLFIRSQNVYPSGLRLDEKTYITEEVHEKMKSSKVKPGDVLLNITGASLGRCTYFPSELGEANVNQHVCIIRPSKEIDTEYLTYFLNSWEGRRQINSFLTSGNREGLNFQQIGMIEVDAPEIRSQKSIVKVLNNWKQAIAKLSELIFKKEEVLKGYVQKMEMITEGETLSLNEIGTFKKGKGASKKDIKNEGKPCVRYGELYTRHNVLIKDFESYLDQDGQENSFKCNKGDILFAGSGETISEIGKCAVLLDKGVYAGGDVIVMTPNLDLVDPVFISFILNGSTVRKQLIKLGQGSSVIHIYPKDLKKVQIRIPHIHTQKLWSKSILLMDREIDLLRCKLKKLKEQQIGLIQKLLEGRE